MRVVVAGRRAAGRRVASRRRTSQRYGDTVGQEPGRPASWGSFAVTRRIQVTSVVLSLAVAVALAACGGDGDSAERDRDAPTTTSTSGEPTTTTTAASGTTTDEASDLAIGLPGDVGTQLEADRVFTGEGSEEFCAQARALQESVAGSDPSSIDEASVAGQLAALTPPAEIAADWGVIVTVQQALVDTQAENPLASVDQAQLDAYGQSTAVVAAYLGDVCRLSLPG
jgi:hypothetical protein